ncbi:long-chain fatty acid--CoA ligase [Sphingomonas sp. ac-8]|uniref:long-chain-fatty-acid--CoA ligase n=1 Tax=Sphingomonas sp. ac-8 TaxID=3242977 RepID=UPI003A80BA54
MSAIARTPAAGEAPQIVPRLIPEMLDRAATEFPERTAIDFLGRTWAYADIADEVRRAARGLQDLGVRPGMRVGLCLPNTPYYVIAYFAVLRIGAVVVAMNPLYVERELHHLLVDSGAELVIVPDLVALHDKLLAACDGTAVRHVVLAPMAAVLPWAKSLGLRLLKRRELVRIGSDPRHVSWDRIVSRDAAPDPVAQSPDDLAVLQYTGGTTGEPKGAMLSHANLTANSQQMVLHVGHRPEQQERTLGVLPLFHVFALTTVLNYSVETAAEMILLPRFDMQQFLATLRRTRPTQIFAVPTIYNAVNQLDIAQVPRLDFCHTCISGGAPLPLEVRQAFEERTGCRVVEGYGLSEASPIIACNPLDGGVVKANSTGPAFPGTRLEVRDLIDPTKVLPQGERGEVCVRGPQVMLGYWNRPDATEDCFIDGALRTGDVGYFDADGYLFLVDRIKDMLLCGGYNVYPRVIEEALYEHPAVAEAVVIGVSDVYRGQAPKAFVTLRPDHAASVDELCGFLRPRLSKIEFPREIEIRDSLPKTLIGKLSKKELVAEETAKRAAQASTAA